MRDLVQEYLFRRREDLQGPLWLVESVPVKGHPNFTWGTIVPIPEREFMGVREDDGSVVIVVVPGKKTIGLPGSTTAAISHNAGFSTRKLWLVRT